MVSLRKFFVIGYIYAAFGIVASIWGMWKYITKITADDGTRSDDREGELRNIKMVVTVCLSWLLFSVILVIGMYKKRIRLVKAHKTFIIVFMVLWLVFAGWFITLLLLFGEGGIMEYSVTALAMISLIIYVFCATALWIVNGVIRYMENAQSTREHLLPMVSAMLLQSDAEAKPTKPEYKSEFV